ncbi:MAG: beta-glucosidase, partial [Bacteroidales bacterium]|nr:beta-glucosidase [Bacteroidales bacterium]
MKRNFSVIAFVLLSFHLFGQSKLPQLGKNKIEEVIDAMTIEEKVSMVMGLGLEDEAQKALAILAPGAQGITFSIPRLGIPHIIFCDGPAGIRLMNIKGTDQSYFTAFPVATAMAATW